MTKGCGAVWQLTEVLILRILWPPIDRPFEVDLHHVLEACLNHPLFMLGSTVKSCAEFERGLQQKGIPFNK